MQRRRLMELGVSGCLVATLSPAGFPGDPSDLGGEGVAAVLRGMMGSPAQAAAIGRACLAAELVSPNAVQAFLTTLGREAGDERAVTDLFRRRRAADFADGRLQSLHGWQLAESESLAFAAVALS